jgi:hypothetical protein
VISLHRRDYEASIIQVIEGSVPKAALRRSGHVILRVPRHSQRGSFVTCSVTQQARDYEDALYPILVDLVHWVEMSRTLCDLTPGF